MPLLGLGFGGRSICSRRRTEVKAPGVFVQLEFRKEIDGKRG